MQFHLNQRFQLGWDLHVRSIEMRSQTYCTKGPITRRCVGGISGAVGNTVQMHSVGKPAYSFFVYEQVYNADGKPIENLYVDRNKDGSITPDDRYHFESPGPDYFLGFSSQFRYKSWDLSFSLRSNIGNYVYNNVESDMGHYARVTSPNYMLNTVTSLLDYGFETASVTRYLSDFYVVNASFLRMDNLSLGYRLKDVFNTKTDVRLSGTVQNVFVVSKYNGIDPEISNGIDNNIYPRPRTFLFGVTVDF